LDASTIDLCLSVFPWARFRKTKSAVKLHTLLDLRGNIPTFVDITEGKVHDVNVLDVLIPEFGAIYVMDRGYLDFGRLFALAQTPAFFIIRTKSNTKLRRLYSQPDYPEKLRRIRYFDDQQNRNLVFLTNPFALPALTIADLYRCRWQVELFFNWIKQHLRIKAFFGTSENAVKTQIWIAISVYVLVAILKKRLKIEHSLYTILQLLSLTLFEKISLSQLLEMTSYEIENDCKHIQLNLFDS
jgi:IS4 transposase